MPIKETKINGKITDEAVQSVVILVEIGINSLWGSFTHGDHYRRRQLRLRGKDEKEEYETGELLDIYQLYGNLVSMFQETYDKNATDLYEFFYQESGFDEDGYYACQFPIDWAKFKKKRVAEKLVRKALHSKKNEAEKMVEYMKENFKTFLRCLKIKVKWKENF